jgi:hypothetical protein
MSDKSQELLLGNSVQPPERLDEDEDQNGELRNEKAVYESSVTDVLDHVGHPDFKFIYFEAIPDIKEQYFKRRHLFVKDLLEKVSEVYDFEFFEKPEINTDYELDQILLFIEFLEFDNYRFISYVWRFLKQDLQKIDIEKYCKSNSMKIIKETEEQLETHPQIKIIDLFLRTYYKEKYIEWFVQNTKKSKIMIILEILESEGKLNG